MIFEFTAVFLYITDCFVFLFEVKLKNKLFFHAFMCQVQCPPGSGE